MKEIVEKINSIPDLFSVGACTQTDVKESEEKLGLKLSSQYIDYVMNFGCISFDAVEWTGLNIKGRLNVVEATENERKLNQYFPSKAIVLEDIGIDEKVVAVDEKNVVYLIQKDKVTPVADSLVEYLDFTLKTI